MRRHYLNNVCIDDWQAYKRAVELSGDELLLPGLNLTHEQLFYLNFAQVIVIVNSIRPPTIHVKTDGA